MDINNLLTKLDNIIRYYVIYQYYFIKKNIKELSYTYSYTIQYNWLH